MANIGEKRPPEQCTEEESKEAEEDGTLPSAPKKPAPSFNFRPSPLQQATRGFSLKQSTLPSTSSSATEGRKDCDNSKILATPLQGGFLKLDSEELTGFSSSLGAPSPSNAFRGGGGGGGGGGDGSVEASRVPGSSTNQVNHSTAATTSGGAGGSNNLFLQFVARTSSANSFSSMASVDSTSAPSAHNPEDTPTNADEGNSEEERVEGHSGAIATRGGLPQANGEEFSAAPGGVESRNVPFGFQGTTAILPEVHTVTGEEKEKKIVQVPARLYTFDVTTHTWKERGRGKVRLNDAAQSEGFFQSRLVMRTAGSYHVLLNTHLWAQMKCERANQKSIRITAQHGEHGQNHGCSLQVLPSLPAGSDLSGSHPCHSGHLHQGASEVAARMGGFRCLWQLPRTAAEH